MKKVDKIIIIITCSSNKEANNIKEALLKERLAACVNIISNVNSFFWWQNKIDSSREVMLLAKTRSELFKKIVKLTKKLHSYEVPEIIALPIVYGSKEYLEWIDKSLDKEDL